MSQQNTGVVNIRGKEYKTVALRVQEFRESEAHENWSLVTEIVVLNESQAVVKATILTPDGRVVATGFAEEMRGQGNINRTSALENAETSAIGRALANLGFGGTEFASANEVQNAIQQQQTPASDEQKARIVDLMQNGLVTPDQLRSAFGHSDVNRLLEVEAARVIQAFTDAQRSAAQASQSTP